MAIEKVNQSGFYGPVKFSICLIMLTKSGIYAKCFVIVNYFIDQVVPWSCLSKMCTVLALCVVNVEISRTVPVCCITGDYQVLFLAVERKNLRIRHNLL